MNSDIFKDEKDVVALDDPSQAIKVNAHVLEDWNSVVKCFKSETAPFPAQKNQNPPPIFTIKK